MVGASASAEDPLWPANKPKLKSSRTLRVSAQISFCFFPPEPAGRRWFDASEPLVGTFGGIAQLVERQLCKLDVRGSNPLASTNFPLSSRPGSVAQLVRAPP
jgi:hypothetical protein